MVKEIFYISVTYADGSSKENIRTMTEISCSPLFAKEPGIRKKKAFKSVGSKKLIETADSPISEPDSPLSTNLNPELQKEHNEKILGVLNNGSLKEIQGLQTLGPKRAQLIFNWRSLHGSFSSFEGLNGVEGLNPKFVSTFLRRNLVHL